MNPRFVTTAVALMFIAGCNTMHGVGEDVSAGGRKVEDVLKKDKSAGDSSGTTSTPAPATTGSNPDNSGRAPDTSMSTPPSGTKTQ